MRVESWDREIDVRREHEDEVPSGTPVVGPDVQEGDKPIYVRPQVFVGREFLSEGAGGSGDEELVGLFVRRSK